MNPPAEVIPDAPPDNPPPPPVGGPSPPALAVFARLCMVDKVAVPEVELAGLAGYIEWYEQDADGPPTEGDASPADPAPTPCPIITPRYYLLLAELEAAGLLVRWIDADDRPAVTYTPATAAMLGLKLDRYATRWVPETTDERSVRVTRRQLSGGREIVAEVDLAMDPPGQLDRQIDPKATDPAAEVEEEDAQSDAIIRDEERKGGFLKPMFLKGADMAWPVAGQDRGPLAPWAGEVPKGHPGLGEDLPGPCGGCLGHVRDGELCLACDRYYAEVLLPRGERLEVERAKKAGRASRTATRKGRGGGGGRKRGRGKADNRRETGS